MGESARTGRMKGVEFFRAARKNLRDIESRKFLQMKTSLLQLDALLPALICLCTLGPVNAATYIVDSAVPEAADGNPGTELKPLKTVQRAVDLARPGDSICVMPGQYPERVKITAGGAPGQPLTVRSVVGRAAVIAGFEIDADYISIEGFDITAEKPATAIALAGSHCVVLGNYIYDMMVAVSGSVGKVNPVNKMRDYSAVAHNRIAYNQVFHSEYGFILGGDDWLVENNEINRLFMYAPGKKYEDCDYTRFFGKGCVQRFNYYHGSISSEIRVAHVDCLQTFSVNGEIAQDLQFQNNVCFDFHQLCMVESEPHIGSVKNWTFLRNIVSANSPGLSGGWGPDIIQTPDVTIANNTIATVRWAAIGLRGRESSNGQIRNNILFDAERAVVHGDKDFTAANPVIEYNLTEKTAPLAGDSNLNGRDPLFVDAAHRNFRLQKGSPAIGAGKEGATIGALEYPNVYYVDPRHPAASDDPPWGYAAVPLASLTKACALAEAGETIVLRGGVYRETLRPRNNGVTVRAMKGEQVLISGADLIEGWTREKDGIWSAAIRMKPKTILQDGQTSSNFTYDEVGKRIKVKDVDPRLHTFETIVRERGIDLGDKTSVKVEGISVVNTLIDKAH